MRPRATAPSGDDAAMFILYAVVAGLVIGLVSGGSAGRLGDLRFSLGAADRGRLMVVQVLLFSTPLGDALGPPRRAVYVASNVAVLVAVLAQPARSRACRWSLLGGARNLVAICANGGYMPVEPGRARRARAGGPGGATRTAARRRDPVLGPLTDIFAMPAWLPVANVFSVGDVLIGVGAAIAIVAAMHGRGPLEARTAALGRDAERRRSGLTRRAGGASVH